MYTTQLIYIYLYEKYCYTAINKFLNTMQAEFYNMVILSQNCMRFIMMYVYPHTNTRKGLMQTAGTTVCSALMRFVVRRWCDIL